MKDLTSKTNRNRALTYDIDANRKLSPVAAQQRYETVLFPAVLFEWCDLHSVVREISGLVPFLGVNLLLFSGGGSCESIVDSPLVQSSTVLA